MKAQIERECRVIRPQKSFRGKQDLDYQDAISAESVGAKGICMHFLTLPPGARGKAHLHEGHETAIYVLTGEVGTWWGQRLEKHFIAKAGDYVYIPANMPHFPYNISQTETATAVIARTDPHEQESVQLLPELDEIHRSRS